MRALSLAKPDKELSVLCLGAHSDDIEIGCGATILGWIDRRVKLNVHWCVLSAIGARADEAAASAEAYLRGANSQKIELGDLKDGYFPYQGAKLKDRFELLKQQVKPDIVFTHRKDDAHQDHREVSKLTWNSFRDHVILEYEIPKWDGDIGQPNLYQPVRKNILERKVDLLLTHFGTQRSKDWFDANTFLGLARLRGMECRAPEMLAEAFFVKKLTLD
jgi:LmbE family N-acetylglucosaminyl deacetylase